ncbi:hypothetical protein KCP69_13110 [Salmonella enterica subsp. enterica]|nr:hypothetical protein KCP69_13110 [Salmonella enterica subsp. enterica]
MKAVLNEAQRAFYFASRWRPDGAAVLHHHHRDLSPIIASTRQETRRKAKNIAPHHASLSA